MSKNRPSQHDQFSIKGYWWLPDSDERVAGELCYAESDLTLTLYGGLSEATADSPFNATPDESEHSLIHGESEDNTPLTVIRAFYTKWTPDITTLAIRPGSKVGLRSSQLHCSFLVEGVHLSSECETFAKCRVEIPSLDVWLGISPFDIDMKDSYRHMSLQYVLPENDQFEIERSACQVSFIHAVTPPGLPFGSSPAISHHTFFEIAPPRPQPLKQLLECSSDVVDLLSIAYGCPVVSMRTMFYLPSDDEPRPVYYPRHEVEYRSHDTHDFLVRYKEIDDFSTVLDSWMNSTGNLKRARRMLISSERRPSEFIELRFLPLAHALEVLSNEATQTTFISATDFKNIRTKMLETVDGELSEELKSSIKSSLQWANGRSLRDKLRCLLSELQDETLQLLLVDVEQFLSGLVKTRNHYTHYSTKAGGQILQGKELHWAIRKVTLMLRVILMMRTGVPEDILQKAIRTHMRLAQERRVWADISEIGSKYAGDE